MNEAIRQSEDEARKNTVESALAEAALKKDDQSKVEELKFENVETFEAFNNDQDKGELKRYIDQNFAKKLDKEEQQD
jgi:hypothetical protein